MNHVSLFSGIGGIDLAAQWAGMQTVLMVERDKYCQRVLRKNFAGVPIVGDIKDVTAGTFQQYGIDRVDVLSGGFPCQPYSQAGERRGAADERAIWPEMLRVIQICKPAWVLGENVVGIVGMALDDVCISLEGEGYEVQPVVFPACAVGAWHVRQRVFIVAHANGERQQQPQGQQLEGWGWAGNTGADVQYAMRQRLQELSIATQPNRQDIATRGFGAVWHGWESEPELGRVADGIPRRVDRLRALGNAVVPQQVYPVLRLMMDNYVQQMQQRN